MQKKRMTVNTALRGEERRDEASYRTRSRERRGTGVETWVIDDDVC